MFSRANVSKGSSYEKTDLYLQVLVMLENGLGKFGQHVPRASREMHQHQHSK